MTMSISSYILIMVLLVIGFFLGFIAGLRFMLEKIRRVCGYDLYIEVIDMLHTDASKEE